MKGEDLSREDLDHLREPPQIRRNPKTVSEHRSARKEPGGSAFRGTGAVSKLDEPTVRKIRAEAKHWPLRVLAKRYGVRIATISEIINRRTWANIA